MESNGTYWKRLEERQAAVASDGGGTAARETSAITVQIPMTGERIVLERGFTPALSVAPVRVEYVSETLFTQAEVAVFALGIFLVLLFRHAVRKLRPWVEVGVVFVFLGLEVVLDIVSPLLAARLLWAGLIGLAGLALLRLCDHVRRLEIWTRA